MGFKLYSFWGLLRGYLVIYGTPLWIYGVEGNCTGDLWGLGSVYGDQGEGTLSHLDVWDTPEPFEVSLQEAVDIIWVKLSHLEEGTRPVGTPCRIPTLGNPWDPHSRDCHRDPHPGHLHLRDPHPGHPKPGETTRDPVWAGQGLSPDSSSQGCGSPVIPSLMLLPPHQLQPASPPVVSAHPSVLPPPVP